MVHDDVLLGLAKRFGLDPLRVGRPEVFEAAISEALALMPAPAVIDEVAAMGGLSGARDPWGVVLSRLRRIPELARRRAETVEADAEARRWRQVDRAASRGETLRALVDRGDLSRTEALEQLGADFSNDVDLLGIARAALTGGNAP